MAQATAFLRHVPVVIHLTDIESAVNWSALQKELSSTGLSNIGVSGCIYASLKSKIDEMKLSLFTEGKEKVARSHPAKVITPAIPVQNATPITKTRLIDVPVRSGQRIYAPQCDLIVTNHVSAGAELIADGNIHVYGMM